MTHFKHGGQEYGLAFVATGTGYLPVPTSFSNNLGIIRAAVRAAMGQSAFPLIAATEDQIVERVLNYVTRNDIAEVFHLLQTAQSEADDEDGDDAVAGADTAPVPTVKNPRAAEDVPILAPRRISKGELYGDAITVAHQLGVRTPNAERLAAALVGIALKESGDRSTFATYSLPSSTGDWGLTQVNKKSGRWLAIYGRTFRNGASERDQLVYPMIEMVNKLGLLGPPKPLWVFATEVFLNQASPAALTWFRRHMPADLSGLEGVIQDFIADYSLKRPSAREYLTNSLGAAVRSHIPKLIKELQEAGNA